MPPLVIPDTVQVVATGGLAGGENWANVFHVINSLEVTVGQSDADLIGAHFRTFYAAFNAHRVDAWTLDQITVRDIDTAGENVYIADVAQLLGDSSTIPLPYECATTLTWRTPLNTRRGRGRTFLNGWGVGQVNVDAAGAPIILASQRTAIASAATSLLTNLAGDDFPLGIASRADLTTRPVVGGYIDSNWDTVRARSEGITAVRTNFP